MHDSTIGKVLSTSVSSQFRSIDNSLKEVRFLLVVRAHLNLPNDSLLDSDRISLLMNKHWPVLSIGELARRFARKICK